MLENTQISGSNTNNSKFPKEVNGTATNRHFMFYLCHLYLFTYTGVDDV
jgi:hypothetical protein